MQILIVLLLFLPTALSAKLNWIDKPVDHPPIPLLDEEGNHVLQSGKPYSPRKTCGGSGCHDYDKISSAYHFEMGREQTTDDWGLYHNWPGASHLVGPGWFGGFDCMSGPMLLSKKKNSRPEEFLDYGTPDFVAGCSSCHAGGGFGEKDREGIFYTQMPLDKIPLWDGDYYARKTQGTGGHGHGGDPNHIGLWDWNKSGLLENDCLFCHASEQNMKLPDERLKNARGMLAAYRQARAKHLGDGNFRYAASTIWEFLQATGKNGQSLAALSVERQWDEKGNYTIKKDEAGNPIIHWNPEAFDDNGRIHVKMMRIAENENCMACHVTSNSRRGYYGFGEVAKVEYTSKEEGGTMIADYKDDIHKGADLKKYWPNVEANIMDNCNVCHARGYFKSRLAPVNLDMDHNFLKGNSDMDSRNDLDFVGGMRTCEYCHVEGRNPFGKPVIPSGQSTLLAAHLERWKHSGFLAGYPETALNKIVQTHFDVVSCEACHITRLQTGDTTKLQIMYRYRQDEDGRLRITPYNPRFRNLWVETTSTPMHALSVYEKGLVLKLAVDESGQPVKDQAGNMFFDIIDPETQQPLGGRVTGSINQHTGGINIGDPVDAQSYRALKRAYDKLMKVRLGIPNPDVKLVWLESNEYTISHNTRAAVEALACGECHTRKENGAFSSLLAENGVLGQGNRKIVVKLPDAKLVEEGVVMLREPYMQVAPDGTVYEEESDILFGTLVDPYMTTNRATSTPFGQGKFFEMRTADLSGLGIDVDALLAKVGASLYGWVYPYGPTSEFAFGVGKSRAIEALVDSWLGSALTFVKTPQLSSLFINRNLGQLSSNVVHVSITQEKTPVDPKPLGGKMVVLLKHASTKPLSGIRVLTSPDGNQIAALADSQIISYRPSQNGEPGQILFISDSPGYFAVVER